MRVRAVSGYGSVATALSKVDFTEFILFYRLLSSTRSLSTKAYRNSSSYWIDKC